MDKSFDNLRHKVLRAVDDQRSISKTEPRGYKTVFAEFVHMRITKLGIDEDQLAQSIHLSADQVHSLLRGVLPDEALTDDLLQQLAQVIQYDASLLYFMLNRPVSATRAKDNLVKPSSGDSPISV